jgi:hypothetical protein
VVPGGCGRAGRTDRRRRATGWGGGGPGVRRHRPGRRPGLHRHPRPFRLLPGRRPPCRQRYPPGSHHRRARQLRDIRGAHDRPAEHPTGPVHLRRRAGGHLAGLRPVPRRAARPAPGGQRRPAGGTRGHPGQGHGAERGRSVRGTAGRDGGTLEGSPGRRGLRPVAGTGVHPGSERHARGAPGTVPRRAGPRALRGRPHPQPRLPLPAVRRRGPGDRHGGRRGHPALAPHRPLRRRP